ncbi:MAG: hypothetical protein LBB94_07950, partial [Clostridiales bacterium]|nr:hypothetical protein [Clostridiales bacterium]
TALNISDIAWNAEEKSITVNSNVKIVIGEAAVWKDGVKTDLPAAPYLYEKTNYTYVPVDFFDYIPVAASQIEAAAPADFVLEANNWAPGTLAALNGFMLKYGVNSPDYDSEKKPYVVFDFDNTTSFFDVEEALLIYQLENLRFSIPRDKMFDVLTTEVPKDIFTDDYLNAAGEHLNIDIVAQDAQSDYEWLYDNYEGFGAGAVSLEDVRKTPQYQDFITKIRFLYDAIGSTFDAAVSYPWVTYLFTGMTPEEVNKLATESHDYWFAYTKWEKVKWTSPESLPGKAGVVSVSYKTSIAIPPESKDLYTKLQKNGFDVYVCSASFIDVIEALAYNPKYGLNVPKGNVYAMMLKKDAAGRYLNAYDYDNYFQTQGPGKKQTIDKFILPRYEGRGPLFVAGDSQGDYNMITEYADMRLGLIVNRVRGDDFQIISKQAVDSIGDPNAKYVLQGRDENKGVYVPSEESVLLGSTEALLVKE